MRILHTADWHLGKTLEGRGRLEEQADFLDELVQMTEEQQIDLVLIAGDVYDTVNPPAAAEQLFYDAVTRLSDGGSRPVVVISGNHDNPDRLSASGPLASSHGISLWGLPTDRVQKIGITRTGEQACIYPLAYPSESRLQTLLSTELDEEHLRTAYSEKVGQLIGQAARQFDPSTVNLIMSHIYVLGGMETESERPIQVGGAYTVDTRALDGLAQYVALGHLHRPQTLKADRIIRYSGSPLAYSFSEAGQAKSVTVLDASPGQAYPQMEEIFLSSGRPLVRWKAKNGLSEVHQWLDEKRDSRAWIDLELHVEQALTMEQIQTLRKSHEGLIQIRPVYPEWEAEREEAESRRLPVDEMFARFYRRQTGGADPEPELTRLFLELIQYEEMNETAVSGEEDMADG